jgi:hypothetical protein
MIIKISSEKLKGWKTQRLCRYGSSIARVGRTYVSKKEFTTTSNN